MMAAPRLAVSYDSLCVNGMSPRRGLKVLLLLALASAVTLGNACAYDVAGDGKVWWDRDADTISTQVELEPINQRLYGFDTSYFDANPSRARGCPGSQDPFCTGGLYEGLNLPDRDTVHGYYHYYQPQDLPDGLNTNDWGTLSLINLIEATSRSWVSTSDDCFYYRPRYLAVWADRYGAGDLSRGRESESPWFGGPWFNSNGTPRHTSHQNGRDLDVRFLRLDRDSVPLDLEGPDSGQYDWYATLDLFGCILEAGNVEHIFVDTAYAVFRRRARFASHSNFRRDQAWEPSRDHRRSHGS